MTYNPIIPEGSKCQCPRQTAKTSHAPKIINVKKIEAINRLILW
jgi:hypothetical protein